MFLKEGLQLDGANLKVLKQTMKMGVIASTSSPSYFPLSQLEWLCLEEVNDLFYLLQYNMESGQKELKEKRCFKSCGYSRQSKGIILFEIFSFRVLHSASTRPIVQGTPKYLIGSMTVSQNANILFCR